MSLNNLSTTLPSVEKLIQRTAAAEKSQQKEIRITIQEARDLTTELASMTAKLGKTVQEIHQLLVEIRDSTTKIDVKFDGGGFGS
jgi:ABC-type transporter Mla subunit MlaD